ncbi:M16 family metallopeptidase [Thalassomonas haliotis]|uniref:Insulinase family protein n=1 Tax=Thalassomonas haliotis TaxID=485448 RepID=A0ABY7VIT6_9GAMM|nr:pitrilysin family protein [Thalassomonas haliotis]WDE12880.1 insulinase family protein [Thalassomonas haliotis]
MKPFLKGILLTITLLTSGTQAATTAEDIKTFTLKNGMKIMVLPDNSIPNANMYLFWRVGSRNEYPGITGLSHFFEHMMFNGAKKYGPKMFDRTMEAAGGSNNAYTTENLTVYSNWFPTQAMETIFALEADRIADLAIDQAMVESERSVVSSERTTGLENSNFDTLWQEVKGAAFRAHPYSWPVIGHASDIENWSIADLKQYYKTYYAPNNAVVVISGDVDVNEVKALAKKYFAAIPAQPAPKEIHTTEPKQTGERRVYAEKASVTTDNIMLAYHVPNSRHRDFYALDILSDILATGKSSRLYHALVNEQQFASDVFTYFPKSLDANLFYLYGVAAKDIDVATLEKAMIKEVNDIIRHGINNRELQKVKNRKLVDFYRTMSTIDGKSDSIGSYELYFGDYRKLFSAPQEYNQVTAEDIQRVAKTYLVKANRTVGILSSQKDCLADDI